MAVPVHSRVPPSVVNQEVQVHSRVPPVAVNQGPVNHHSRVPPAAVNQHRPAWLYLNKSSGYLAGSPACLPGISGLWAASMSRTNEAIGFPGLSCENRLRDGRRGSDPVLVSTRLYLS